MPVERVNSPQSAVAWQVNWHASVDSTMSIAHQAAMDGAPAGLVEVADYQRQGRGTNGRDWTAAPGTCLMFTLVLRPDCRPFQLADVPHQVASAIASYVNERFGLLAVVKEPNDVMLGDRKLAGVLCSSRVIGERVDFLLVGIGLNTFMTEEQLPIVQATSLTIEGCDLPDHEMLLGELLLQLEEAIVRLD